MRYHRQLDKSLCLFVSVLFMYFLFVCLLTIFSHAIAGLNGALNNLERSENTYFSKQYKYSSSFLLIG